MATPKQLIKRAGSHSTATVTVTPEGIKALTAMAAAGQDQRSMAKRLGLDHRADHAADAARYAVMELPSRITWGRTVGII